MKIVGKIFIAFFLLGLIAAGFPSATQAACLCTCTPKKSALSGVGQAPALACDNATADISLGEKPDQDSCTAACLAKVPDGGGVPPCYISYGACATGAKYSCWCKAGTVPFKKAETSSESDCKTACSSVGNEFAGWGNTPPATVSGAVKCPPGGVWTGPECQAIKNSFGAPIGKWDPPPGYDKGPYCYAADIPVKLGVSMGGLTQANLAQYLAAAYRLGLGIAAILAVIMIMVGGFRYLAAAGGGGIEKAKEMIKNAVIGLVLTVASYTLLQTVNPDILSLRLPRVQMIKACSIQVDCGSRPDRPTCESKNSTDPSKQCMWNPTTSQCFDNAINQSGAQGKLGGECKKDDKGNFTCDGGTCVYTGSNKYSCSLGAACQACTSDTVIGSDGKPDPTSTVQGQCAMIDGKPGKCESNFCSVPDPSGSGYKRCTNTKCDKGSQCATGFCNSSGFCASSNEGSICKTDDDCRASEGYKCTLYGSLGSRCCLGGDITKCGECTADAQCPDGYYCPFVSTRKRDEHGNCAPKLGAGIACTDGEMCSSKKCDGGKCAESHDFPCDPTVVGPIIDQGKVKDADEFCSTYAGGPKLGADYYCNIYKRCSNAK